MDAVDSDLPPLDAAALEGLIARHLRDQERAQLFLVERLLDLAARKSQGRSELPARLNRFPFSLLRPAFRLLFRAHALFFHDQRQVNLLLIQALRDVLSELRTAQGQRSAAA